MYKELKEQDQKDTKRFQGALWKIANELENIRSHLLWIVWILWSGLAFYMGVFFAGSF